MINMTRLAAECSCENKLSFHGNNNAVGRLNWLEAGLRRSCFECQKFNFGRMIMTEKNLEDLFHDTLKDIYYAERKILSALPKMAKAAQSEELKAAFQK